MGGASIGSSQVWNSLTRLVAAESIPSVEEGAWQVRRGKVLHSRGAHSLAEATACFKRAVALGSSDGKYHLARLLLEDAAGAGNQLACAARDSLERTI